MYLSPPPSSSSAQMKLHELVSAACAEDDLDPLTARSRKLACHVALLRELSASNAFGPLNSIMARLHPSPDRSERK